MKDYFVFDLEKLRIIDQMKKQVARQEVMVIVQIRNLNKRSEVSKVIGIGFANNTPKPIIVKTKATRVTALPWNRTPLVIERSITPINIGKKEAFTLVS